MDIAGWFAIYDGHGGAQVAKFGKSNLAAHVVERCDNEQALTI